MSVSLHKFLVPMLIAIYNAGPPFRVGSPEHVKYNCMPYSNLGIVYGPNLLRQREMVASLALLADMTAQAKAIEILIAHVHEVSHAV